MARSAESILEDIYEELRKNNKNKGVNDKSYEDLLRELRRNKPQNSNDNDSSKENKKKDNGILKALKNKAKDLGSSIGDITDDIKLLTNVDASPVKRLQGGLDIINDAIGMVPFVGKAISSVLKTVESVFLGIYSTLNTWYEQYSEVNTAGIHLTGGIVGLQKDLGTTMLSFSDFTGILKDNNNILASFGDSAGGVFSNYFNALVDSQKESGQLNMSFKQMGNYVLGNLKAMKIQGVFNQMQEAERRRSEREYADNLNTFSKVLGVSTDELNKRMTSDQGLIDQGALQASLKARGLNEKASSEAAQAVQLVTSSMGNAGKMFADAMTEYAARGVIGNASQLANDLAGSGNLVIRNVLSGIMDKTMKGAYNGAGGEQKMLQDLYDARNGMISELTYSINQASIQGKTDVARRLEEVRQTLTLMNDPKDAAKKIEDPFGKIVNNINITVRKIGSSLNDKFYSGLQNSVKPIDNMLDTLSNFATGSMDTDTAIANLRTQIPAVIKGIFGDTLGSWITGDSTNYSTFQKGFKEFTSIDIDSILHGILPEWLYTAISKKGVSVSGAMVGALPSMRTILTAMGMSSWLVDILTDKETPQEALDKKNAVKASMEQQADAIARLNSQSGIMVNNLSDAIQKQNTNLAALNSIPSGLPWQVPTSANAVLTTPTSEATNAQNAGTIYQQNALTNKIIENTQKMSETLDRMSDSQDKLHTTFNYIRQYN